MTECNQSTFEFAPHFSRQVVARFDGGIMTSDGGGLLLRETDQRLNLLARLGQCFLDARHPALVQHSVQELVSQRVYGLALGYEDLNDHEQLRHDPLLRVLAGKREVEDSPLAGKSTLNRLELSDGTPSRYKKITYWKAALDALLVNVFVEAHERAPEQIVLDVDTTDLPLHGQQEGRFFHGYYDHYCYLPLYVFCGEHVLCARLRPANSDAAAGSVAEIQRIVEQIRAAWPQVKIILRGDSGFCRNELRSWGETHQVEYVFGLARNQRLRKILGRSCSRRASSGNRAGNRGGCLQSSTIEPRSPGAGPGAWWPKRNTSTAGESPLCGDLSDGREWDRAEVVRGTVLCARRYGEPDQGAVLFVRRPGQYGDDAGQSVAALPVGNGLRAAVRPASAGTAGYGVGAGASIHDPHAAAQDRRSDSGECAPRLALLGGQLSLGASVHSGPRQPAAGLRATVLAFPLK